MKRPIATLDLPEYKIRELHTKGYMFCDDVNIETIKSDIGISAEDWQTLTQSIETKTALDLCEDNTTASHIVTFSSTLDAMLGGGVPVQMITEVTGLPGTGKTQFCLQLAVAAQLPDCFGGVEGNSVYIDTNFGFNPSRLSEMAIRCIKYCQQVANTYNSFEMYDKLKTLTGEQFLKGVHYIQAVKFIELLSVVHILKKLLNENSNIKLVIIDSITAAVKNTNLEYFERIKLLYTFLSDLQKLSQTYKFAIVLTNDMTVKFDENGESYVTSCLGDSFAHRINSKIKMERISDNKFNATIVKNVLNPVSSAMFQIAEAGVRDIK